MASFSETFGSSKGRQKKNKQPQSERKVISKDYMPKEGDAGSIDPSPLLNEEFVLQRTSLGYSEIDDATGAKIDEQLKRIKVPKHVESDYGAAEIVKTDAERLERMGKSIKKIIDESTTSDISTATVQHAVSPQKGTKNQQIIESSIVVSPEKPKDQSKGIDTSEVKSSKLLKKMTKRSSSDSDIQESVVKSDQLAEELIQTDSNLASQLQSQKSICDTLRNLADAVIELTKSNDHLIQIVVEQTANFKSMKMFIETTFQSFDIMLRGIREEVVCSNDTNTKQYTEICAKFDMMKEMQRLTESFIASGFQNLGSSIKHPNTIDSIPGPSMRTAGAVAKDVSKKLAPVDHTAVMRRLANVQKIHHIALTDLFKAAPHMEAALKRGEYNAVMEAIDEYETEQPNPRYRVFD